MLLELSNIRGHVVIVMGPTGSGKGTLVKHALATHTKLAHTISCTSRAKRPNEKDGQQYHFVTSEEFDQKIAAGDFLEWAVFAGNKYGTLKSEIIPRLTVGEVVIVEIELQGVEQLLTLLPRAHMTIVYIEAGGWEVLKARALTRASMDETNLQARYERYLIEEQAKPLADVIIDNTRSLDRTYAAFDQVIDAAYYKCNV